MNKTYIYIFNDCLKKFLDGEIKEHKTRHTPEEIKFTIYSKDNISCTPFSVYYKREKKIYKNGFIYKNMKDELELNGFISEENKEKIDTQCREEVIQTRIS